MVALAMLAGTAILAPVAQEAAQEQVTDPAAFERWVHEGLPRPPHRFDRDAMSSAEALAFDLALLVPERVSGFAVTDAARRAAVSRILDAFDGIPDARRAVVLARLRGRLDAGAARRVRVLLGAREPPRRAALFSLLESVALSTSRPVLYEHAADEDAPPDERGALAERLLLADGRAALERLRPTIRPDAAPSYLRRVLAAWRQIVLPEDLPWLERLARDTEGYPGQFALQLWAMEESDPEARWRAFELLLDGPPRYQEVALEALARGGPHARIVDALRELTESPDRNLQRLARRMLPVFGGHEALLEEYRSRAADASINVRGDWMRDLAASPLVEAQEEAARWLVEGGWSTGSRAMVVTRHLAGSAALDPYLGTLLQHPEIPLQVRFPLAESRVEHHPAARDYLRRAVERESELLARRAVRALARAGLPEDAALFRRVAEDRDHPLGARVAAVAALVGTSAWNELAAAWQSEPPRAYELAVAFLRAMLHSPVTAQRAWAVKAALGGMHFAGEDERRGLRVALWQEIAGGAEVEVGALLDETAVALLESAPRLAEEGESWPGSRGLAGAYGELSAVLRARARAHATSEDAPRPLRGWVPEGAPPEAVYFASLLVARSDQALAERWWEWLIARELSRPDHLRVLGAWATRGAPGAGRLEAWRELQRRGSWMREYPRVLAEVFAPQGRGWTLFLDRVAERRLLEEARLAPAAERAGLLAALVDGWVRPAVLMDAAALLAEDPEETAPAARALAARAADLAPVDGSVHALCARLAAARGDAAAAAAAWERVLRLVPRGHELHEEARAALESR